MAKTGRQGGRTSRRAKRAIAPQEVNPCPPGHAGGQYKPLTEADLNRVIEAAFEILSEIGMSQVPPEFEKLALSKGASLTADNRLAFAKPLMEDIIDKAAKKFTFYGRDSKHDFELGGEGVYFGTGGAAVQTLDLDTGLYRPSTLQDLSDFTRLIDVLENISWFTRCCVATDVPDVRDFDVNTAYALVRGTTKPVGTSFTYAETVDPIIDMFDCALGGEGKFAERPFCKAHISPVISPLRYGEDAFEVIRACVHRRVPINAIIVAQSGATAPAPLAGILAQTTAETLAALAMVNMVESGYPMIFSNWPFVIDLRTGSFCGGGGEISILNAASAQISNRLGLPSGVACSMADAKAVDAQMGAEKAMSAVAAGLAGANMIYESAGMSASLLGASFEAFLIDNEMLGHVHRMIRGIEVTDETIGIEAIRETVKETGHFLSAEQTLRSMQSDYYYPIFADRADPKTWEENGAPSIEKIANRKVKEILRTHRPQYLSAKADEAIRRQLNILL